MLALGIANIAIATYADFATWAWFVSVGLVGTKLAAFALQYLVFRILIRQRRAGAAAAAASRSSTMLGLVAALIVSTGAGGAGAVGFQQIAVPDPQGQP